MEKRISVFISRTIFFTREKLLYHHLDWLFLTSEENRIDILLTTWPPCWGRRERVICFYVIKKKSFSNKKTRNRKKNSLFRPNDKEINGMNDESVFRLQYFVSTLFVFDRLPVLK